MINTYQIPGRSQITLKGKKEAINITPAVTLLKFGSLIEVKISSSLTVDKIRKGKRVEDIKSVSGIDTMAMIDTGASRTVITPRIADELKLIHTGHERVTSVHDTKKRPVYAGYLLLPWGRAKKLPMLTCPLPSRYFECLIGRDILAYWQFTYNGSDGFFTICD